MSALGHKQTCALQTGMSALPPKADMCSALAHVCFGPKADIVTLFDHLVGTGEQRRRHCEAECLRGRQIHDQIKSGRLLDWEIGRLRPAQYLVDNVSGAPEGGWEVRSVGHQTACFHILSIVVHRWQSGSERQSMDANPMSEYERFAYDVKRVRPSFEGLQPRRDILCTADFQ